MTKSFKHIFLGFYVLLALSASTFALMPLSANSQEEAIEENKTINKAEELEEAKESDGKEEVSPPSSDSENKDLNEIMSSEVKTFDGLDLKTLKTSLPSLLFNDGKITKFYEHIIEFKKSGSALPESLVIYEEQETGEDGSSINEDSKDQVDGLGFEIRQEIDSKKSALIDDGGRPANVSPSFFLSSILYQSPGNWTIWFDGKKTRFETKDELKDIEIVDVTFDSVTVLWNPKSLDKMSPNYTSGLRAMQSVKDSTGKFDWNLKSPKHDIHVDGLKEAVQFKLKPNQSFIGYYMKIVEGKADDVPLESNSTDKPSSYEDGIYPDSEEEGIEL